jgi:hypothetical protein
MVLIYWQELHESLQERRTKLINGWIWMRNPLISSSPSNLRTSQGNWTLESDTALLFCLVLSLCSRSLTELNLQTDTLSRQQQRRRKYSKMFCLKKYCTSHRLFIFGTAWLLLSSQNQIVLWPGLWIMHVSDAWNYCKNAK